MLRLILCLCVVFLFIQGCVINKKTFWEAEKEIVATCYDNWQYQDLQKAHKLIVLLYNSKYNIDIYSFPNFLIGVSLEGDTIAIMDKYFEGKISRGDTVTIEPDKWSEEEKAIKKPLFTMQKRSFENKFYCAVDTIFYGRIRK